SPPRSFATLSSPPANHTRPLHDALPISPHPPGPGWHHPGRHVRSGLYASGMDEVVSRNPATGAEVGRFPVADAAAVTAAVDRARAAGRWWAGLGFGARRRHLLHWRALVTRRMTELAEVLHAETGKPIAEGIIETAAAIGDIDWAARH